jgi:hypothetical protein
VQLGEAWASTQRPLRGEQLLVDRIEIPALILVLPGEVAAMPDVGEAVAAGAALSNESQSPQGSASFEWARRSSGGRAFDVGHGWSDASSSAEGSRDLPFQSF